jgi:transposase
MFFKWLLPGKEKGGGFRRLLADSFDCAVSVDVLWTLQHRVLVFETYIGTKSIIAVQRRFHIQFTVECHGNIPDYNTILRWVETFRATGSVMKRKPPGLPAPVRTPENVERMRVAVLRSLRFSARRQDLALWISDRSVRQILHKDLKFDPCKIMIVRRLLHGDFAQ